MGNEFASIRRWRWLAVVGQGILAGAASFVAISTVPQWFRAIYEALAGAGALALGITLALTIALLVYLAASRRPKAILGIPHLIRLPPLWLSIGFAVLTYMFFAVLAETADLAIDSDLLVDVLTIAFGVLGGLALAWIAPFYVVEPSAAPPDKTSNATAKQSVSRTGATITEDAIDDWLNLDDQPLRNVRDDLFGRADVAARLLLRLAGVGTPQHKEPTQVIRGLPGIGKTSILQMMLHYCQNPQHLPDHRRFKQHIFDPDGNRLSLKETVDLSPLKKLRFVRISAWQYSTSESLVHAVIESVVDALYREADTLFLRGLSKQYVEAMKGSGGIWAVLSWCVLVGQGNPEAVVSRLSAYLGAADIRVIVWLDDLERFHVTATNGLTDTFALLDLFRTVDNISFVLAVGAAA